MVSGAEPFLRVRAVNVYVRDQQRSLCFYLDMIEFWAAFDARVESRAPRAHSCPLRRSLAYQMVADGLPRHTALEKWPQSEMASVTGATIALRSTDVWESRCER